MASKLKYGNVPEGRYGADDGIVNVVLNRRHAVTARRVVVCEKVAGHFIKQCRNKPNKAYSGCGVLKIGVCTDLQYETIKENVDV